MLNRMWSDRRERNLRYAHTCHIVLEEGEPLLLFAIFDDDVIRHTPSDGYAPLHRRLSIIGRLRRPGGVSIHPTELWVNRKDTQGINKEDTVNAKKQFCKRLKQFLNICRHR